MGHEVEMALRRKPALVVRSRPARKPGSVPGVVTVWRNQVHVNGGCSEAAAEAMQAAVYAWSGNADPDLVERKEAMVGGRGRQRHTVAGPSSKKPSDRVFDECAKNVTSVPDLRQVDFRRAALARASLEDNRCSPGV